MSIQTPLSWAVIIYVCYNLSNLILSTLSPERSDNVNKSWKYLLTIILLSSIAGLAAMNLDMILDPYAVSIGAWTWINGGPYYNIPISNFIGWFSVVFSCTLIFRASGLYTKRTQNLKEPRINNQVNQFTIVLVYLSYLIGNATLSIDNNHPEFALIGIATMLPFILIALLKFATKQANDKENIKSRMASK
jgi:putative membrane protein